MILPEIIDGTSDILLLCDHASAAVPAGVDLGVDPRLMDLHIAIDIGAAALTRALAAELGAPAVLGMVSRLVIDLHRQPDHPRLIPEESDGHAIPGNAGADRGARIAAFHAPYHAALAAEIAKRRPKLIASIHSFTPCLEDGGSQRPWEVGVLYNRDARAARPLIDFLRAEGLPTGDNEPYSGRILNATLNRHAEATGIPSAAIEVRNDGLLRAADVARWTDILAKMLRCTRNSLAQKGSLAT